MDLSIQYDNLTDKELIDLIFMGNQFAVVHLLTERCAKQLNYLASVKFKTLGIEFDVLVSEIFILLQKKDWKALRAFEGRSKLVNYISLIASRWLWKQMDAAVKDIDWLSPLNEEDDNTLFPVVDGRMDRGKLTCEVMEYLQLLENGKEQLVLIMYGIEGYSVEEVAAVLHTSSGNVYTIYSRSIAKLRRRLKEEGINE